MSDQVEKAHDLFIRGGDTTHKQVSVVVCLSCGHSGIGDIFSHPTGGDDFMVGCPKCGCGDENLIRSFDTIEELSELLNVVFTPIKEDESLEETGVPSKKAQQMAISAYMKDTTVGTGVDPDIVNEFALILDQYIEALQWCSASPSFQAGGEAREGFVNIVVPLIKL